MKTCEIDDNAIKTTLIPMGPIINNTIKIEGATNQKKSVINAIVNRVF